MSAFERLVVFAVAVLVAGAAVWAWTIDQRTDSIATIAEASERIERAASSTQSMLADSLDAQQTPEAREQRSATSRAVAEIHEVKLLLCDLPELADHDACP